MLKQIVFIALLCLLVVRAAPTTSEEAPSPYNFAFEEADANFTITRQEAMDERGVVTGSYSYVDKHGIFRTVNYIADDDGFRASVESNEPGLVSSAPAGVLYNVQ